MEVDVRNFIYPLLKWWWLIAIATVVAGGSSYLATSQQVPIYESSATLMIGNPIENPNPNSADIYLPQQLARTYVDLANRPSLRNAAMESLGIDWLPPIVVRHIFNTNFVEIIVTDTSPERAQAVAAEMSRQLVLRSPTAQLENQERQAFVNDQLNAFELAIEETQAEIEAKNKELGELVSAREIAEMQAEIAALQASLQTLQTNYAALLPSSQRGATNTVREIEAASFPTQPVDQKTEITILLAAGIGFALAVTAAYVLEYLDDTVETPELVTKLTNLPVLAGIARIQSDEDTLITVTQPRSPTSEAFRVLRTAIQFSDVEHEKKVLLVTSAVPAEGKSVISSNLAVVMAQAGYNTLLIDADLRRPTAHQLFGLPNKRGLTSLLLDFSKAEGDDEIQNSIEDTIQTTQVGRLQILSCGPLPPNPSELLGSSKMRQLLDILSEQFDMVILDSPPVLTVTDAVVLAAQVDGTVLTVRAGVSKKDSTKQAVQRLSEVNVKIIGCVLNALTSKNRGYGVYYYYRDPDYVYGGEGQPTAGEEDSGGKLRKRFWGKQTA